MVKTIQSRAIVVQKKTGMSFQFEITGNTRKSIMALIEQFTLNSYDYLFKSRTHTSERLLTRQYGRIELVKLTLIHINVSWCKLNSSRIFFIAVIA